jgi:isoquinoline 1-oxidoreductase beta subunit
MSDPLDTGDVQVAPSTADTNDSEGILQLSRRRLLVATAVIGAAGAGLLIGFELHARDTETPQLKKGRFTPNAWLRIDADNTVTVTIARSEAGQGVLTALAMLVADELDADWSQVRAVQAPADSQYGNQRTTGSGSVAGSFQKLRFAGAQARALLVAAAAHVWGASSSTCRTEKGTVLHPSSGRRLTYGQLAGTAATLRVSLGELKSPEQFRLVGTRAPCLDTPAKVDGSAVFGLDVRIPEMLFATVARSPVPGGTLSRFDATRAQAIPGVRKIVRVDSGVAVIAEHTWAAVAGQRALDITWNEGANASLASDTIHQQLVAKTPRSSAASGAARVVEAVYETPYQAHTPMEPLNCTVRLQSDSCEVWVGTQDPQGAQNAAAQASGVAYDHVKVHIPAIGGAFGRRASSDFVTEAVNVAKAAGNPVQVMWTREDDLQNGFYRPGAYHHMRAALDDSGKLQSWQHGVAAQSMGDGVGAGAELPYAIPSIHINGVDVTLGVPVTIWRGAEYSYMTFAVESFIDEIAAAASIDPYKFRRGLLNDTPRLQAVLDLAASKSGWDTTLPDGQGRGIAAFVYSNSDTYVAEVAEASVGADGTVRVHRVVCAVDCGLVINPAIAEAQVEGSIVQGLSAALKSEITFAGGRVKQTNFDSYPLLRLNEMPAVETYFVASSANPSGLGEPALPPIAPAVANAIFAATGKRVRRLPIRPGDLR